MDSIDLQAVEQGLGVAAGPLQTWVLPALLGLGLASATGLRTFLPLLPLRRSASPRSWSSRATRSPSSITA